MAWIRLIKNRVYWLVVSEHIIDPYVSKADITFRKKRSYSMHEMIYVREYCS